MITRAVFLIIGYLCGLLQSGYLYGRIKGIDIRTKGSGNVGATNTLRVFGVLPGIAIFLCDFLKAFIPCLMVKLFFEGTSEEVTIMVMWMGLGAILGHNFPFYIGFRGGKGVASTLGVFFAINWKIGLAMVAVFAIVVLCTRIVSLASVIMMVAFMITGLLLMDYGLESILLIIFISGMSIIRHATNIERLLRRKEKQI